MSARRTMGKGDAMIAGALRLVSSVERVAGVVAAVALAAIMFIATGDVAMRYVFNKPFAWAYDLISLYLMVALFYLVVSGTYAHHAHVAVDIRENSPTYGQWVGVELSGRNHKQLWIPPGLAHGFLVTSDSADFLYKTTAYYRPDSEGCIRWDDPNLAIPWPLDGRTPSLSAKDAAAPMLRS